MRLLLDSHVFVWFDQEVRLASDSIALIQNAKSVSISAVTIWELEMKRAIGKGEEFPLSFPTIAAKHGFILLPIVAEHAEAAAVLPLHHRDPFDRMLVAQAMIEDLTLVTHDATLSQYAVAILKV